MKKKSIAYLLVNFGGPRSLSEIEVFLKELLNDQDVVRTSWPSWIHSLIFGKIAKKRAHEIAKDYALIGGKSPIYEDTEMLAKRLEEKLGAPVLTFHRYLPMTHPALFESLEKVSVEEIRVFPLFPQFTYATTGSIARLLEKKLPSSVIHKCKWIKSYPTHRAFLTLFQEKIREFLNEHHIKDEEVLLLFSAHGLPQHFIEKGDLYQAEVEASFEGVMEAFPHILGKLCYQSKFGRGEWLRPYTVDVCEEILMESEGRKKILVIPISFTSDHIETLFEIEHQYLPIIQKKGLEAFRLPAFNQDEKWLEAIQTMLTEFSPLHTTMLIRR